MADDLTADNFISAIKKMGDRDRKKILADRLIELILSMEDKPDQLMNIEKKITELELKYEFIKTETFTITSEIALIQSTIPSSNNNLGSAYQISNDVKIKELEKEMVDIHKHLNSIEQYLRVNNIEIVGLPEPIVEETNEQVILKALNSMDEFSYELTKEDIDISHPIPSRHKDGKIVSICKFVTRKTKIDVLDAKKKCREFKFKGSDIDIYIYK